MRALSLGNAGVSSVLGFVGVFVRYENVPLLYGYEYETPITPAYYVFRIWYWIYILLFCCVAIDCTSPANSFFAHAKDSQNRLRLCFAGACVANIAWVIFLANNYVHSASFASLVMWALLFILYRHIMLCRRAHGGAFTRLWMSEMAITTYFAWVSASIAPGTFAVSAQTSLNRYIHPACYVGYTVLLCCAALYALAKDADLSFLSMTMWTLISLVWKKLAVSSALNDVTMQVQISALVCCLVLACAVPLVFLCRFVQVLQQDRAKMLHEPLRNVNRIEVHRYGAAAAASS